MAIDSNGIIVAPVSIYDVQQTLGVSAGGDLGRICQSAKINMWAKYKPVVRRNLIDTTGQLNSDKTWKTSAQIEAGGHQNESWWKGDDTNHGLTVPFVTAGWSPAGFVTALNSIANMIDGEENGWVYSPPTGTILAPFRLIDFNEYYHDAPTPVKKASGTDEVIAGQSQAWQYSVSLMEVQPTSYDSRKYIVPTDLRIDGTIWESLYVGIAIFKNTGTAANPSYSAMAWVAGSSGDEPGNTWIGEGIRNSDQSDGVDTTSSGQVASAFFKDGGDYYAIPLYFTKSDLQQTAAGESFIGQTSGCKIIPIPYIDFIHFTCTQRSSYQSIVFPSLTDKKISFRGAYNGSVKLSSAVAGYNGSSISFDVYVWFVWTSWDFDPASLTNQNCKFSNQKHYASFADNTEDTPSEFVMNLTGIDISKSWMVVVKIADDTKTFMLIQADQPTLNT